MKRALLVLLCLALVPFVLDALRGPDLWAYFWAALLIYIAISLTRGWFFTRPR